MKLFKVVTTKVTLAKDQMEAEDICHDLEGDNDTETIMNDQAVNEAVVFYRNLIASKDGGMTVMSGDMVHEVMKSFLVSKGVDAMEPLIGEMVETIEKFALDDDWQADVSGAS